MACEHELAPEVVVPQGGPDLGTLLGMGLAFAVCLVAGLGLGWFVDSLTGTFPVFLLVGLVLGIVGSITYAVAEFRRLLK